MLTPTPGGAQAPWGESWENKPCPSSAVKVSPRSRHVHPGRARTQCTRAHARTHTQGKPVCTHICTNRPAVLVCKCTHAHTCAHAHTCTHVHAYMQMHTHMRVHTTTHICQCTPAHSCIHTTDARTATCTYTSSTHVRTRTHARPRELHGEHTKLPARWHLSS